ncbi:MAG: phosphoenolpyruvate carboxykinase (ATP) [Candidatus Zixiibacteriota bacterium]
MKVTSHGSSKTLEELGLSNLGNVYWNATTPQLYEEVVHRHEGYIAHHGALVVRTGQHTGRSPNDKFIVRDATSADKVWWGEVNKGFDPERFHSLFHRLQAYLQGKDIFIQDCHAGADLKYRVPIRVITEDAWTSIFARNMFRQIHDPGEREAHVPEFTILAVSRFRAIPEFDGTRSGAFVILDFAKKLVLIGGTAYAGEIKKSVFTILNYMLPHSGVMPMHCSANIGHGGDTALFFGLSGTGKTTLSADPERLLIGDDEHGWSDTGVFNFEGGCYAKVVRLSAENEPEIFAATRTFGTILENVGFDVDTRKVDLDDVSLTENTRAAYPLSHISNSVPTGVGGHPKTIVMLTCDAFGVLPPVARLTPEQASYQFISGYTAKVAGTEIGMGNEPKATFSTCFGAPFMALPPAVYSKLLREKIARHKVACWLVNTGWSGGGFGVGKRISLPHTRSIIHAVLSGELDKAAMVKDPIFGIDVPRSCPNVPAEILNPRNTWKDKAGFDNQAKALAVMFHQNFVKYTEGVPDEIKAAGPTYKE